MTNPYKTEIHIDGQPDHINTARQACCDLVEHHVNQYVFERFWDFRKELLENGIKVTTKSPDGHARTFHAFVRVDPIHLNISVNEKSADPMTQDILTRIEALEKGHRCITK